jgi:hypothetical protein
MPAQRSLVRDSLEDVNGVGRLSTAYGITKPALIALDESPQ